MELCSKNVIRFFLADINFVIVFILLFFAFDLQLNVVLNVSMETVYLLVSVTAKVDGEAQLAMKVSAFFYFYNAAEDHSC